MKLEGKVAIVTGGARGIGRAVAERLLTEGASVVIADMDERSNEATAGELAERGQIRAVTCNVAERLDVHNLVATALDAFGAIHVLVNNAGIAHKADFLDLDAEDFERVLAVNLKGAFLCSQAVARHFVERVEAGEPAGSIVNVSSINAVVAIPDQVGYCVSKGGLTQLTRVMALSLAKYGIRVNAVGPGSIMTDMLKTVADDREAQRRILSRTPLGRIGEPEEIAGLVAFLASQEASYVTAQTLYADGGRLALNYTVAPGGDEGED